MANAEALRANTGLKEGKGIVGKLFDVIGAQREVQAGQLVRRYGSTKEAAEEFFSGKK